MLRRRQSAGNLRELKESRIHPIGEQFVVLPEILRALEAVDDGGVITSAEGGSNLGEVCVEKLPREQHGSLARHGHFAGAAL
jgi:hypothetical protein